MSRRTTPKTAPTRGSNRKRRRAVLDGTAGRATVRKLTQATDQALERKTFPVMSDDELEDYANEFVRASMHYRKNVVLNRRAVARELQERRSELRQRRKVS